MNTGKLSRRALMRGTSLAAAGAIAAPILAQGAAAEIKRVVKNGRIEAVVVESHGRRFAARARNLANGCGSTA